MNQPGSGDSHRETRGFREVRGFFQLFVPVVSPEADIAWINNPHFFSKLKSG